MFTLTCIVQVFQAQVLQPVTFDDSVFGSDWSSVQTRAGFFVHELCSEHRDHEDAEINELRKDVVDLAQTLVKVHSVARRSYMKLDEALRASSQHGSLDVEEDDGGPDMRSPFATPVKPRALGRS